MNEEEKKEYDRICAKLGFDAKTYRADISALPDYEDDSRINPFSVLDWDELRWLDDHVFHLGHE